RFHHQLGINLLTKSIWFQEAGERDEWHPRTSRAQLALDKCLEVAVPWADLQTVPDWQVRLIAVLSAEERFSSCLSEDNLIAIGMP
ncbi:MAG: glycoside hydrolase, partial [Oscillatoriales cyanobacterium RU_3_3]|nr:glycoside hydrolase [Oscillatoriales cyanobacterium RU_3_3]